MPRPHLDPAWRHNLTPLWTAYTVLRLTGAALLIWSGTAQALELARGEKWSVVPARVVLLGLLLLALLAQIDLPLPLLNPSPPPLLPPTLSHPPAQAHWARPPPPLPLGLLLLALSSFTLSLRRTQPLSATWALLGLGAVHAATGVGIWVGGEERAGRWRAGTRMWIFTVIVNQVQVKGEGRAEEGRREQQGKEGEDVEKGEQEGGPVRPTHLPLTKTNQTLVSLPGTSVVQYTAILGNALLHPASSSSHSHSHSHSPATPASADAAARDVRLGGYPTFSSGGVDDPRAQVPVGEAQLGRDGEVQGLVIRQAPRSAGGIGGDGGFHVDGGERGNGQGDALGPGAAGRPARSRIRTRSGPAALPPAGLSPIAEAQTPLGSAPSTWPWRERWR